FLSHFNFLASLLLADSDSSPDSRPEEELIFDKDAVEKLTEGLISYYVPDLQRSRLTLQELTQNQGVVLDTLEQEISKFRECHSVLDINALVSLSQLEHNCVSIKMQFKQKQLLEVRQ
uniref:Biosis of lysosomal organelles complex 1 subunit 6 n=1 Tax=Latimeria chalumnae TaxID=7897 RepID=H2ZRL6_LATCH